uniref:transposase n=1 Tax=Enterococcus italicus TaxID=246144 RepID=UPI0028ACE561|nr:transposase [Enterococcus italicus]
MNYSGRYKQLKKYWKLLQKKQSELDWCHRKWQPSFKDYLTQTEIVDRLLSYDSSLAKGYETYQAFLRVLCYSPDKKKQEERVNEFEELLSQNYSHLPESYRTTISTFKKYRKEIILALSVPYSNGPVEATNNHIKVIKRMAYGFRNFINFKIRIFINRGKYFRTLPRKGKEKGQATKNGFYNIWCCYSH